MEVHLKAIGCLLILLASIHVAFPKYFHWKKELTAISLINKQMMYMHTLFIAITILLMGILCIVSASDLINTTLGKRVSIGFGVFWLIRLIVQFFGYSSSLWKRKKFETCIHILFSILWIYFTFVFFKIGIG